MRFRGSVTWVGVCTAVWCSDSIGRVQTARLRAGLLSRASGIVLTVNLS